MLAAGGCSKHILKGGKFKMLLGQLHLKSLIHKEKGMQYM